MMPRCTRRTHHMAPGLSVLPGLSPGVREAATTCLFLFELA